MWITWGSERLCPGNICLVEINASQSYYTLLPS